MRFETVWSQAAFTSNNELTLDYQCTDVYGYSIPIMRPLNEQLPPLTDCRAVNINCVCPHRRGDTWGGLSDEVLLSISRRVCSDGGQSSSCGGLPVACLVEGLLIYMFVCRCVPV